MPLFLNRPAAKTIVAIGLSILAAFSFACMSAFSKIAQDYTNFSMIIFFRFLIAWLALLPSIAFYGGWQQLKTRKPFWHLIRAVCGFTALICMVAAIKYIPLVDAILLNIMYPLFMPLLLFLSLGQRISMRVLGGLLVGFMGVIITLRPDPYYLFELGALLALASGFFTAIAVLLTKQLSQTESNQAIGFYLFGFSVLASLALILLNWETPSLALFCILLGIGVSGLIYQQAMSYALKLIDANYVTALMYTSIIFGSLFSWWIWQQVPDIYTWFGVGLIAVGSLIVLNIFRHVKS